MLAGKHRQISAIIAALMVTLIPWTGLEWHNRRSAAYEAVAELAQCQRIAADIRAARTAPQTARPNKQEDHQVARAVQAAADVAEISREHIVEIRHMSGRRLEKSAHIEQPVDVEIRKVKMEQLTRLVAEFDAGDSGLQLTSIHLSAPRSTPQDGETEVWDCELVLTYLVFSPE